MRVLAIDPGYQKVGIALLEKAGGAEQLLYSDCFTTSPDLPHERRLLLIGEEIGRIAGIYAPQALALERLFFNTNERTALRVSEARGVIVFVAAQKNLPIFDYTPPEIKIALTGHGRSDKKQVMAMVDRLLRITKKIKEDDEYDAIAAGLTFFAREKADRIRALPR